MIFLRSMLPPLLLILPPKKSVEKPKMPPVGLELEFEVPSRERLCRG
jgi:hypothetical protein